MVVAPPAARMARSARIHSTRVLDRMATRVSASAPSPIRPAAIARTRSSACFQVSEAQPSPLRKLNAVVSGVLATRSTRRAAIEAPVACSVLADTGCLPSEVVGVITLGSQDSRRVVRFEG